MATKYGIERGEKQVMTMIYGIKRGGKYRIYVKLRNQIKNMVRKAKPVMEKDIAKDVKKNPKRFWKYASSKRKTKSEISELKYKLGNEVITTKGDMYWQNSSVVSSQLNQKKEFQY